MPIVDPVSLFLALDAVAAVILAGGYVRGRRRRAFLRRRLGAA